MFDKWFKLFGLRQEQDSAESAQRFILRAYLTANERRLRRGPNNDPKGTAAKLSRKRFARNHTRRLAKRLRTGGKRVVLPKALLISKYRPNVILESLLPNRSTLWTPIPKRIPFQSQFVLDIKCLSFIEKPIETLEIISELVKLEATTLGARVNFRFDYCEDIGPFLLLSEMWPGFAPVFSGGVLTGAVQKVIESVGLRRALRMDFMSPNDHGDIWAMPVQRRRPAGTSESDTRHLDPQRRETVCDMVCDQIDAWLLHAKTTVKLTPDARGQFKGIIGEILDNAERHSSPSDGDGTWTVAAFMARRIVNGHETYVCYMAFLSLGATFAEGLKAAPPSGLTSALDDFVANQVVKNRAPQSADTLITLAALQDGVTRDPKALEEGRGGTGLLDMADMVCELAASETIGENSRITIISGRSCIMLRRPYLRGVAAEPEDPRRLWCNEKNSRLDVPDIGHVFDLPIRLPGTVISVSFNLDPDFLRSATSDD